MKKITRIVPVVLGALALASCSSDEMFSNAEVLEATQAGEGEMIAVVDENPDAVTRYGLDNANTMFVWSQGDTYTVYDQTLTKYSEFDLDPAYSGSKAGKFTVQAGQEDIVDADGNSTARYGVFPYRAANKIVLNGDHTKTFFTTLPSSFAYEEITHGANGDLGENVGVVSPLPLWGSVKNETGSRKITFWMMTGMLKVDLSEVPADYGSAYLIVKSAAHKLSGKFMADITEQTKATYSAEAPHVELVKDTDPGTEANDQEIKVTFNTGSAKIPNRVFYLPIPVGTYEAGDLTVELYGNGTKKADLTPEAWKSSEVKIERATMKKIAYTIAKEITANSIAEINQLIYNALVVANSEKAIEDGKTFSFTVSGAELKPKADDNILLIPTFNGKNINVILNITNDIDASAEALNIAEAAYGDENAAKDGRWTVKSGKTPEEIKDDAAAAQRTFTVNLGGTTNSNSLINVLAPTSNVSINAFTAGNTIKTLEATTANETNSLQLGVEGNLLTGVSVNSRAGGVFVGPHASIGSFLNIGNVDVNFYGVCFKKFTKYGSGILYVGENAAVKQLTNWGGGNIIVDGHLTDGSALNPSLWNMTEAAITINGSAETVKTKGKKIFTVGSGASITLLTTNGSGEILIQGEVATINNKGTAAITINSNPETPTIGYTTINNFENGGDVNVTRIKSNLTINNDSKTANLMVDFANAAYTATLTDNSGVMTAGTATGNMTVKNTSGLVKLTNIGGAVELENCSGDNVITNDDQNGAITLKNSYAFKLTNNNNSSAVKVTTSGKAGIGEIIKGDFMFEDKDWNGKAETRNFSGNIYTAAQLAGLTESATTQATITLKTDINLQGQSWAGIKQGAMTTFDGGNFTVSKLTLKDADQIGLFATAGTNDLTIQNLKLNTVKFASTGNKNCIGALVGEFNGGSLTVDNVTVEGVAISSTDADATKSKSNSIAALVGKFAGNNLKFNKATIGGTSTITGTSSLAGFVGNLGTSNNVEFDACKLSGLTITVQGTPADAVAGRVGYLIGGVSGTVANLKVSANLEITPATLSNDQRVAWKYKRRKQSETIFFWGDARGYLGYCEGTIGTYVIGTETQIEGIGGTYNLYEGY